MRLTVSQNPSLLPDHATNTFWVDAPLGDTSLTASALSLASCHFVQLASVQRMRRDRRACWERLGWSQKTLGGERSGVQSKWVEKGRWRMRVGDAARERERKDGFAIHLL